jgi:hypothetical protein
MDIKAQLLSNAKADVSRRSRERTAEGKLTQPDSQQEANMTEI